MPYIRRLTGNHIAKVINIFISPSHLFTSSADWAMKKPCVLGSILILGPGLIAIQLSDPSSLRASIAIRRSFSFKKHILKKKRQNLSDSDMIITVSAEVRYQTINPLHVETFWGNKNIIYIFQHFSTLQIVKIHGLLVNFNNLHQFNIIMWYKAHQ